MSVKIVFPEMTTDLARITLPCAVQAKYDGELVVWSNGCLTNRYGKQRLDMPCVEGLSDKVEIIGELYWDHGRKNFYEALSHLKTNDPALKFCMFAFYNADLTYAEQYQLLKIMENHNPLRKVVESVNAYSTLEVEQTHKDFMNEGYEGSVIKPLAMKTPRSWIKWKPDETMDLYVLGVSKKKGAIAVGTKEGKIIGHCSTFGKQKEVDAIIGKYAIIGDTKEDYLITPAIMVEVNHLGVIEKSGNLRSPRISRFREDKI